MRRLSLRVEEQPVNVADIAGRRGKTIRSVNSSQTGAINSNLRGRRLKTDENISLFTVARACACRACSLTFPRTIGDNDRY